MASIKVFDPVSVPLFFEKRGQLRAENYRLRSENERLRAELAQAHANLDEATRRCKRQAAPISKAPPKANPKKSGRKSGSDCGHRPSPPPDRIDVTFDAPLPTACPCCGGAARETSVAAPFQAEIPLRPVIRRFRFYIGQCHDCGKRVQGRHPLQTSDAQGAVASQLDPGALTDEALAYTKNNKANNWKTYFFHYPAKIDILKKAYTYAGYIGEYYTKGDMQCVCEQNQ